jgi:hypothetical protein
MASVHPNHPSRVFLAAALLLAAAAPLGADFELASPKLFELRYASSGQQETRVGPEKATAFDLFPNPAGGVIGRWRIPVLEREAHVYLALIPVDAVTSRWGVAVLHPGGLPADWWLDRVEQHFSLRQTVAGAAGEDLIRMATVYGPTAIDPEDPRYPAVIRPYPNFLQTQQVTLVNPRDGLAASVIVEDAEGHRKCMGFKGEPGTDVRTIVVSHIPENLGQALTFIPRSAVLLRTGIAGGLEGAIRWYRNVQQDLSGSFLNRRRARGVHRFLEESKLIVYVGAKETQVRAGHRYDVTNAYIQDLLRTFGDMHGPGLIFYVGGWEDDLDTRRRIRPDMYDGILPGYQRLVNAVRAAGHRAIPYFLPDAVSQRSRYFDTSLIRLLRSGEPVLGVYDEEPVGWLSYYSAGPGRILTPLLVDTMMQRFGFDGAYFDALSASHFCHRSTNPADENEQLDGIRTWLNEVRGRLEVLNREGLFANETPTEVFSTDVSGLDVPETNENGLNLFRRTYSGREWPSVHMIFEKHPLKFLLSLARGLVHGARPMISWPEDDIAIPNPARSSARFRPFFEMLGRYCGGYDGGFRTIIDGALKAELASFRTTLVPPLIHYPAAWTKPVPAVLHGVFAPDADSSERVILLARWTAPDEATLLELNLASTHPLRNVSERVEMDLSRRALDLEEGGQYRVIIDDPVDGTTRSVGVLPETRDATLGVSVTLEPASFQFIRVVPLEVN